MSYKDNRIGTVKLEKPNWVAFNVRESKDGSLSTLELPHDVSRIYFIKSVPNSAQRGFHAHRELRQIFFAPSGEFELELSTPFSKEIFLVSSREGKALIVPPGYWRVLSKFSKDSICMVLASAKYDPNDYIRDYLEYMAWFRDNVSDES